MQNNLLDIFSFFIFDLDGTLYDTNNLKSECFFEIFHLPRLPQKETILALDKQNLGLNRRKRIDFLYTAIHGQSPSEEIIASFSQQFESMYADKMHLAKEIPGANHFLTLLNTQKKEAVLISATPAKDLYAFCKTHTLEKYFSAVISSEKIDKTTIIRELISTKGLKPEAMIYFGDTIVDANSAKNNNINFWAILGADFHAENVEQYSSFYSSDYSKLTESTFQF